jgi:hypothetical protein
MRHQNVQASKNKKDIPITKNKRVRIRHRNIISRNKTKLQNKRSPHIMERSKHYQRKPTKRKHQDVHATTKNKIQKI